MSETSEVLRRAAGLMRERAEAATPGPWAWEPPSKADWPQSDESLVAPGSDWQPDSYFGGCSEFLREFHGTRELEDGSHVHRTTVDVVSGWGYDACGTDASDEDRAHIASWHPAVALAVADWLEEAADHLDVDLSDESLDICPTAREGAECSVVGQAVTVARAYLGADQ